MRNYKDSYCYQSEAEQSEAAVTDKVLEEKPNIRTNAQNRYSELVWGLTEDRQEQDRDDRERKALI